jgi:hypothetical protein
MDSNCGEFGSKLVSKRSNERSLISTTDFGRISPKLAKIQRMVGFCAPIRVKFDQFGKISTRIDGAFYRFK